MPEPLNDVRRVLIDVNFVDRTCDVQAGFTTGSPSSLPLHTALGEELEDVALVREILAKIGAAYPRGPISLCVRDPDNDPIIVADTACGAGSRRVRRLSGTAASVSRAVAPAPKAPAPRAAKPKTRSHRKSRRRKND